MDFARLEQFLTQHYDLGSLTITERLQTNGQRFAGRVNGSQGQYVVKVCDPDRPEAVVRTDVATPAYLAAQGFPAPRPIPAQNGALYLRLDDHRYVYLYEMIQGEPARPSDDFYPRLGRLMARLHALPVNPHVPRSAYRPPQVFTDIRAYLSRVTHPDQIRVIPDLLERIDHFPDFKALPSGIIHSDPYFVNILEDDQKNLYLIDWDDGGISYPLLDVGYILAHLVTFTARDRGKLGIPGSYQGILYCPEWSRAFLQAYEEIRPLNPLERSLLPEAIRLSFLVYLPLWERNEIIMENYQRMQLVLANLPAGL